MNESCLEILNMYVYIWVQWEYKSNSKQGDILLMLYVLENSNLCIEFGWNFEM